jgi:hypothetical protein
MSTTEAPSPAVRGSGSNDLLGQASEALTVADVRQAAFELCEFIEDIADKPTDLREVERFKAGQRYAAKWIRNGLGTWLADEENRRKAGAS